MHLFKQSKFFIPVFVLLFITTYFFIPSNSVHASSACICTKNSDCLFANLDSSTDSAGGCSTACQKAFPGSASDYGIGNDADVKIFQCQGQHNAYVTAGAINAAKAAAPSPGEAPPEAAVTPVLNVPIPGLKFLTATNVKIGDETAVSSSFLSDYISAVYKFLIGISLTIAIVMVLIGGLQYVLASGSGKVEKGKTRIKNATIGLVLLLSVYLILYTVNPQLTLLSALSIKNVANVPFPEDEGDVITDADLSASGQSSSAVRLCSTPDTCTTLCANPSSWPSSNAKTINPNLVTSAVNSPPGFINDNPGAAKGKVTAEVMTALQQAGKIAQSLNANYSIHLASGYRPLQNQIQAVCDVLHGGNATKIAGLGHNLAWPGGSNHGSGIAVDVELYDGKTALTEPNETVALQGNYKKGASILLGIMTQAGFVRLKGEIWHFELATKAYSNCRCNSEQSCGWPPKKC